MNLDGITFDAVDGGGVEWSALKVLALLARFVMPLRWSAVELDLSPSPMAELAESMLGGFIDGPTLITAFAGDPQVIEGDFIGTNEAGDIFLQIRAIDGAHWDIYARDPAALEQVNRFVEGSQEL